VVVNINEIEVREWWLAVVRRAFCSSDFFETLVLFGALVLNIL